MAPKKNTQVVEKVADKDIVEINKVLEQQEDPLDAIRKIKESTSRPSVSRIEKKSVFDYTMYVGKYKSHKISDIYKVDPAYIVDYVSTADHIKFSKELRKYLEDNDLLDYEEEQ